MRRSRSNARSGSRCRPGRNRRHCSLFGGGELLGDILRDGSPGIEIRLVAVSGGRLPRHRDADKQRGERDHQRGDERGETAGSRDARIARIVGTGCVALRDAR